MYSNDKLNYCLNNSRITKLLLLSFKNKYRKKNNSKCSANIGKSNIHKLTLKIIYF